MAQFYNIVNRKIIQDGKQEKILHHRVGNIKVTNNGEWFLQMFHLPETEFQILSSYTSELPVTQIEDNEY
ncbi:hypothetical protein [Polaribacter vadi]|uniref:hypothetical protein n=1 Tax=Polaribacter vadi TaxID=1774273 RepID=UPI0030EBDDD4|tara:strand:- start:23609 stop:23818 length:210 start_codon:yes stop_codon:yes gene_type:complete